MSNGSSDLAASGPGADSTFGNDAADAPTQGCSPKAWVEIQLIGEDDRPIAGEAYRLELPDGRIVEGRLDGSGVAAVRDIEPGSCRVSFPDLDAEAWEPKGG